MFKVRGATVYLSEVEQALREVDGVDNAFVTNVAGAQGARVGATVVCNTAATTIEGLRESARRLLVRSRCRRIWLLVGSDDAIPPRPTGKIDARRLRGLLADANAEQAGPR